MRARIHPHIEQGRDSQVGPVLCNACDTPGAQVGDTDELGPEADARADVEPALHIPGAVW